jgi:pantothenate kinase
LDGEPLRGHGARLSTSPILDELLERARGLAARRRAILGITGPPGSGKSTLAAVLARSLDADGLAVANVPMDGFHLADDTLVRLRRRGRKGAIDTFDGDGYLALLRRVRTETDRVAYAPAFDRTIEQPVAGSIAVEPATRLVVTEGNYLLAAAEPWPSVRAALDEVWYCEADDELRLQRLVARHVQFGKPEPEARRWVEQVDEVNTRLIAATRAAADLIVDMSELQLG